VCRLILNRNSGQFVTAPSANALARPNRRGAASCATLQGVGRARTQPMISPGSRVNRALRIAGQPVNREGPDRPGMTFRPTLVRSTNPRRIPCCGPAEAL
jgi:hypothetical protein